MLGAGAAVAAWAALVEPRRLIVRRPVLELERWPAALDGLRVAMVADLHAGGPNVQGERVTRVVDVVNREAPDLVVLLGDFVDTGVTGGSSISAITVAQWLMALRAPLGVHAVLGNHDWRNVGRDMASALAGVGIGVLENEAVRVREGEDGEGELWVAGVADATERRPDVDRALSRVPAEAAVLLLSHDPDVFVEVPERVALTLSGHTHGGQVAIPGLRGWVIRSEHGGRYAEGHVVEGARHLYVTAGVGESTYPVRLLAPPEVVLLTLRAPLG